MAPTLAELKLLKADVLKAVIHENAEKVALKEYVSGLKSIIEGQNAIIKSLENKMKLLENEVQQIKQELDYKKQYSHRISFNVYQEDDESSERCGNDIAKLIQDEQLDISVDAVDSVPPGRNKMVSCLK